MHVWHIFGLAALLGVVNAFDIPGRQSFLVDMVGKEDLMNAIALNSSMFNGARVVGPAIAGILVAKSAKAGALPRIPSATSPLSWDCSDARAMRAPCEQAFTDRRHRGRLSLGSARHESFALSYCCWD